MRKLTRPSTVIAGVALCVALGGGAYAASTIPDGSVTHPKLAPNSVWHGNIGNGSVQLNNLSTSIREQLAKTGASGTSGTNDQPGATGAQGPQGAQGRLALRDRRALKARRDHRAPLVLRVRKVNPGRRVSRHTDPRTAIHRPRACHRRAWPSVMGLRDPAG